MRDKKVIAALLCSLLLIIALAMYSLTLVPKRTIEGAQAEVQLKEELEILPTTQEDEVENYFPLEKDIILTYKGTTYLEDVTVSVDYLRERSIQLRFQTRVKDTVKVYVLGEGVLYEVATIEDAKTKIDYTMLRQYKNAILKNPLEEGLSWTQMDGVVRIIKKTDMKLSTSLGEIKVVQVVLAGDGYEKVEYYGVGTGLIKSVYKQGGKTEELELISREAGKGAKHSVTLYVGNKDTGRLEKIEREMNVLTNEEPKHFLTDLLNKANEPNHIVALPQGAMINSIYMDEEKDRIILDMNEAYDISNYNARDARLAISSLAKTVGEYYGVSFVLLTIEASPYETIFESPNMGNPIYIKE